MLFSEIIVRKLLYDIVLCSAAVFELIEWKMHLTDTRFCSTGSTHVCVLATLRVVVQVEL